MSKKNDIIQRFIFDTANARGEIVRLTDSFCAIASQHNYSPSIRQWLGQFLAASSLLSATIKFEGRLSIQFRGQAALKLLLVQCTHDFKIRGLVQGDLNVHEEALDQAMSEGVLGITIKPEAADEGYQGIVLWEHTVAKSIERYFAQSEQLETRLWIAVTDDCVAGLLLQKMPHTPNKAHHALLDQEAWEHLVHLTETVTQQELLSLDFETLLHRLYHEEEVRVFPAVPVNFQCTCSHERALNAVRLLGRDEAMEELKMRDTLQVTCEFCNQAVTLDRKTVIALFE